MLGHDVDHPETVATAIRIGRPASKYGALAAATESGGGIHAVTDEEILAAYRLLASTEGVFCEPASAASVAGLLKVGVPAGSTVVCVLTGHGLKDPDIAIGQIRGAHPGRADLGGHPSRAGPLKRGRPGLGPSESTTRQSERMTRQSERMTRQSDAGPVHLPLSPGGWPSGRSNARPCRVRLG